MIRHDTDRYQQGIEKPFRRRDERLSYGREHEEKHGDCGTIKCELLVVEVKIQNPATGLVYVVRADSATFDPHAGNMEFTTRNEE